MNRNSTSFSIDDPIPSPLVFVPEDTDLNWDVSPLPPPRAKYKRDLNAISDKEAGVTSDWNFVQII